MPVDGFFNLLKPPGMTSHDVVAFVRRHTGIARMGHMGTLDPAATGVLPISVGRATRLFDYVEGEKTYCADIVFGVTTETLDVESPQVTTTDTSALTETEVSDRLAKMVGEGQQVPPMYSAARVGGKRLYELARRGEQVTATAKKVIFYALELLCFTPGSRARARVYVRCSSGAYIRVLAADLGAATGYGAYLDFLVRSQAGRFSLSEAITVEELASCERSEVTRALLPLDWPLAHLPHISLSAPQSLAFISGTPVLASCGPAWPLCVYDLKRRFLGLGEVLETSQLRPRLILTTREEVAP